MILLCQHQKACLRLEKLGRIGTELVTIWFLKDVNKRFELTEIGRYILESIKTTQLEYSPHQYLETNLLLPIHTTFLIYGR